VNQTDWSHQGPTPGCKADVQEVPTVVLKISRALLGLYGVWHYHDKAVPLLPVGLDVFCKLHPEASTELHSTHTMQNSHFHHPSEKGLRIPKHSKHNLPSWWHNLKILVEGELGCFHCIEALFDLGW
jgi:hypothetical protein